MEGETSSAHNEKPNDKTESPTTGNTNALPPKRPKKKKPKVWDHFSRQVTFYLYLHSLKLD